MKPSGKRQEDFTPVETLLCFGLGLVGSPNQNGKVNIRESDPVAIKVAALAKRSPGSLALKLANLDGRRENRAKYEQQLWIELTSNRDRFMQLYEIVLHAARGVGIDQDQLPDFLGLETGILESVFNADQVSDSDLRESIDQNLRDWMARNPGVEVRETERDLLGTARVGQQRFARVVLENCDFKCVFCGLDFRSNSLPSSRMLVASHIKAWRSSENLERIDLKNGLAACPTHDAAFDTYLMTVSLDMRIVRSPALAAAIVSDRVVAHNFGEGALGLRLILPDAAIRPGAEYLTWHWSKAAVSNS